MDKKRKFGDFSKDEDKFGEFTDTPAAKKQRKVVEPKNAKTSFLKARKK